MEAVKFLIDFIVYFTIVIAVWGVRDTYHGQVYWLSKLSCACCLLVVALFAWIYTYAVIGYAVAEIIGRS
jgi:hypothetical protein